MVPAVAQQNAGSPAKISPARKFAFTHAEPQKSQPYSVESVRVLELAGIGDSVTPTAGYLYWRGRISSPDPSIRPRRKDRVSVLNDREL